jgi:ligand-binding sensor domain-containing protein/signal transduction histidine kinase
MAFFADTPKPALLLCLLLLGVGPLGAERLPVKLYTTADGLARNRVQRIVFDSRGFLWVSTSEGLSRFDGYRFVNYGTRDGLASRGVNDLLEARDGTYWVATDEGLCRLHPRAARQLFTLYHQPAPEFQHSVNGLLQDRTGAIWAATADGLFRETDPAAPDGGRPVRIDLGSPLDSNFAPIRAVLEDRQRTLWIGGASGLYRRFSDGRIEAYSTANGLPASFVETLLEDGEGRIWAGTRAGLCRIVADPRPGRNIVERVYTEADGLAFRDIKALSLAPDGAIWAGCLVGGISRIRVGADGHAQIRTYTRAQGLSDESITALAHDPEGNLWVGGESSGLMRIVRSGFLTYTEADGLGSDRPEEVFEDLAGNLCAAGNDLHSHSAYLSWFDGEKFHSVSPPAPYRWPFVPVLQARSGGWWLGTSSPVRLSDVPVQRLAQARLEQGVSLPRGYAPHRVDGIFEDSHGGIWIGFQGPGNGVGRWDPAAGLHLFERTNGPIEQMVSAFAEDLAGDIWMGLFGRGIVRYRNGGFTQFGPEDGVPAGPIVSLYVDEAGRLWVGSSDGGLGRIDQPAAERPTVRIYDAAHGLTSDSVASLTSDRWGRIYAGAGRGVDRLDPVTGRVQHFTTADGLGSDTPQSSTRDHRGWLWFATTKGLSRLIPEPDRPRPPPPIRITALTIGGAPFAVSQLGETELSGLQFASGDAQIEFASVNFEAGEVMRYQYRIESGSGGQWSAPSDQRSVNLAGLSPGSYRFLARAVDSGGQVSAHAAVIGFRIPPPVWARLWFRLVLLAAVSLLLYGIYRFRLEHMLELEHIRTRIATDLHDDIGSSLSQIAILSEVARRPGEADRDAADSLDPLGRVARISRELVDSMADIVWSINPRRDNLLDLTRRMRQFAGEMLVPVGIDFTFDAQAAADHVALGVDLRRQVFLIFKECVSNAARHSGAAHVDIVFAMHGGRLRLSIADDGCGFDAAIPGSGHGLASMANRAAELGGTLEVASAPGAGTRARLDVPLSKSRDWRRWLR